MARHGGGIAVLLAFAGLLQAGPIPVKFQSNIMLIADQYRFIPSPGTIVDDSTFDVSPSDKIGVATFGPSPDWLIASGNATDSTLFQQRTSQFDYSATITDTASHQSATFHFSGVAFANWYEPPGGGLIPGGSGVSLVADGPSEAKLGGNTYKLELRSYYSVTQDSSARVPNGKILNGGTNGADIQLSVQPAGVPEPGTLALAAIGLLPLGLFARKRFGSKRV